MLGTSSYPGKSSATFGYLWKSLEIFGKCSETFAWSSENLRSIFGNLRKCSEIFGKSSKMSLSVCLCNRQDNAWLLADMEFLFSSSTLYRARSLRPLVRYRRNVPYLRASMYYPLYIIFQKSLALLVVLFSSEQNQFIRLQTHAQISWC